VSPGLHATLQSALHPLHAVPAGQAWNGAELEGLLAADAVPVEAAVLVPLVERTQTSVLLTRRTDRMRNHAGQVSFPGGRIDAGDAGPVAAALREAREEIGLDPATVEVLGYLDPLVTITGYRVLPVVARIPPGFVADPQPDEVAEVFELPLAWLMAPDNLERIAVEFGGRQRHVLEFRRHEDAPGQRIWGATASILFNLRERLAGVVT
jgi:8-oxo-dGTP pyrophosphatase MutT (NUDIX family)